MLRSASIFSNVELGERAFLKDAPRAMGNSRRLERSGFTLIELMMVALLLAVFFAIAIPRLWPAIAFGEHDGAARRIANYGRAAITEAAMLQTRYTIKIDLDEQEYWTVRWPGFSAELAEAQGDMREAAREAMQDPMAQGRDLQSLTGGMGQAEQEEMMERSERMHEQMERFARLSTQSRLENVKTDSMLDGIGDFFDEFRLDDEDEDTEEIRSGFLTRTRLPENITIDSVRVSGSNRSSGIVEVDVSPMGLAESVVFYVRNPDDEYYTIRWDPITGGSEITKGRD